MTDSRKRFGPALAFAAFAYAAAGTASAQVPSDELQKPSAADRRALALSMGLRTIPSLNMVPTLLVGDRALFDASAYDKTPPRRGDVVVLRHTRSPHLMIKRVIGLPGDTVQMQDGRLILNGREVPRAKVREVTYADDYIVHRATEYSEQLPGEDKPHLIHEFGDAERYDDTPQFSVPDGYVFLMGDNRDNSEDSRAPSGHPDLCATKQEEWLHVSFAYCGRPNERAIGLVPIGNLLGRGVGVIFTLAGCRLKAEAKAQGAECLPSRVGKAL